jgi:hypothetical protein
MRISVLFVIPSVARGGVEESSTTNVELDFSLRYASFEMTMALVSQLSNLDIVHYFFHFSETAFGLIVFGPEIARQAEFDELGHYFP